MDDRERELRERARDEKKTSTTTTSPQREKERQRMRCPFFFVPLSATLPHAPSCPQFPLRHAKVETEALDASALASKAFFSPVSARATRAWKKSGRRPVLARLVFSRQPPSSSLASPQLALDRRSRSRSRANCDRHGGNAIESRRRRVREATWGACRGGGA